MIDKEISKLFCNNNPRPPGTFSNVKTNAKNFTRGVSERRPAALGHVLPFPQHVSSLTHCSAAEASRKSFNKSFKIGNHGSLLYTNQKSISEIVQRNQGRGHDSDGLFLFPRKEKKETPRQTRSVMSCTGVGERKHPLGAVKEKQCVQM